MLYALNLRELRMQFWDGKYKMNSYSCLLACLFDMIVP